MVTRQEILDGLLKLLGEDPSPSPATGTAPSAASPATAPAAPAAETAPSAPAADYSVGELVTAPNGEPAIVVAKDTTDSEGNALDQPRYRLGYFGSVSEGAIQLG